MEGLNRQEVMQIIDEKLRQLNLGNHYDIFCREHNPLDGTHKESEAIEPSSFDAPEIYVRDYGEGVGIGGDDTVAFQATFADARAETYPPKVKISGHSVITDTLGVTSGMTIEGSNQSIYSNVQAGADDKPDCLITFAPTSEKDLFYIHETNLGKGNYASNINISNLAIRGNSTGGVTYSRYALNLDMVAHSVFENLAISQFMKGHYATQAMTNRFKNIHIAKCVDECFYYDTAAAASTSDVWEGCIFRDTALGGKIILGYGITFNSCLFETLAGGVRIYRECGEIAFNDTYVENVPTATDGFMWNMGNDGTINWDGNNLTICGGFQLGRDAAYGGKTGTWIDINHCSGVKIIGPHIHKYVNGIACNDTANTPDNAVYVSGPSFYDVTNLYYQMAGKMWGNYPTGPLGGAINPKTYGHNIQMVGLAIYANNAAAIAGGLVAGDFYRTNANPDTVCVVH